MFNDQRNTIYVSVAVSTLVFVVLALILGFFLWLNKSWVFNYFAQGYLEKNLSVTIAAPVLSQDWYVTNAVKKASPAVVSIVILKQVSALDSNPFGNLGLPLLLPDQNSNQPQEIGGGSGFLISSDGYIVTNKHVVNIDGADYVVYTSDGKKHNAKVVAKDPVLDLAIMKISGNGYPYLNIGNSDNLQVGQSVIAIGNALAEFSNTVSVGVVSGLSRSVVAGDEFGRTESLDQVIQTDAPINPGNSGGPLLNLEGQVIGINVAMVGGSQNISFALPSNTLSGVLESVRLTGKIIRPYLGVRYLAVTPDVVDRYKLSVDYGVLIIGGATPATPAVIAGSPAAKAGLRAKDIILAIDGTKLDNNVSLAALVRAKKVGDKINLTIWRNGKTFNVNIVLASVPNSLNRTP